MTHFISQPISEGFKCLSKLIGINVSRAILIKSIMIILYTDKINVEVNRDNITH